jgi:hypothetical protein
MSSVARVAWVPSCVLILAASAVSGQVDAPPTRQVFFAGATAAARVYSDPGEALADGFRRLGPDFPGMGEHWVHTGRIVSGRLAGDLPSVLCYAEIGGRRTLVGLAYTLPLRADELPPPEPFGREAWHDHSGEVSEESLLLSHPSSFTATSSDFRLSMVHVWLPLENPSGVLAQNNWKLPFRRAGLDYPDGATSEAARGLSLSSTGIDYYRDLLHWAAPEGAEQRAVIDVILARWSSEATKWLERRRADSLRELSADDLTELEGFWNGLWTDLSRSVEAEVYERVRPLRGEGH